MCLILPVEIDTLFVISKLKPYSFQDGRTPEYYTSNRDELSHGELLDFVKGKFSFDTDAATGTTKFIM
jgi:hypothetical protein